MRLGFAVKVLGDGGLPSHDTRRWQSGPHLRVSLERLEAILRYLARNEIRMYRMASALAPYASHPKLTQFHDQVAECAAELACVGALATELGVRLSFHPGQYTVLNSQDETVQDAAVAELEVHASILDAMGLGPEAIVVLHGGGGAGGLPAAADRFRVGFERLSAAARARLALENDDRVFPLVEVAEIARELGVRVVFDPLHHACLDPHGLAEREALELALSSWPGDQVPKIHYSSPRLDLREKRRRVGRRIERLPVLPDLRLHADLVDPLAFELFLRHVANGIREFDVMLEAKAKDLALLRLREQLRWRGIELG